jgi:Fe-Mn family superoxide dismutase
MPSTMQALACDPTKLTGFSEHLIVSHDENNYGGAVRRLNAITAQLASLDVATAPVFVLNGLKREELIATNAMMLHELYVASLGAEGEPDTALRGALTRDCGSIERWQSEFVAMGKALGGGSGWVILMYAPRDARLVKQWAADHTCSLAGGVPLLALNMYEHAYHIDYRAQAAAYVEAFMHNIHWDHVVQRYHTHAR